MDKPRRSKDEEKPDCFGKFRFNHPRCQDYCFARWECKQETPDPTRIVRRHSRHLSKVPDSTQPKVFPQREKKRYQFKEEIDTTRFFWFLKSWIMSGEWAKLPPAAKAVFPVIARYRNKNGKAWPSDGTISKLCGRSHVTVSKGTAALEEHWPEWFEMKRTMKRKKVYYLELPQRNTKQNPCFQFFRFVLDSGVWCQLTPTAQALYPVMRASAYFDLEQYGNLEGDDLEPSGFQEIYQTRKYDLLGSRLIKGRLAEYAGMSCKSIRAALEKLERNWLIESLDGGWKIYLKTKELKCYSRAYLNSKTRKDVSPT